MFLFSFTPFLVEGQQFYAEITLGGTLVLLQIGILIFVQYWHTISREVPVISKLFYITSGASIMILMSRSDLWRIYYVQGLGYHQEISLLYSLILALVLIFGGLILFDNLNRVRQVLHQELKLIDKMKSDLKGSIGDDQASISQQPRVLSRSRLIESKQRINIITLSWVIGIIFLLLGIILPGEKSLNLDSFGTFLIFLPQAYYYTRDKRLLTILQVQKVQISAKKFHKSFSELDEDISNEISDENIQALVSFIEKADALLYFQDPSN